MSEEEKKIIDRINRSYDDNTQYVEASAKDWNYIVHSIRKLHEEMEEKSTIIMAGAEKVKQLEKEIQRLEKDNDTLSKLVIVNEDKVIKELDLISKDKIREKIDKYREKLEKLHSQELWNEPEDSIKDFKYNHYLEAYKKLLKEN